MFSNKTKRDILFSLGSSTSAVVLTSPLEVIKMNAQVTSSNVTIRGMFKDVYHTHGPKGFYKGLRVSLCGQPAFWALYHPIKNTLEDKLSNDDGSIEFSGKCGSIFTASLVASMTVNPLFVLKTRFQTSVLKKNSNGTLKYPNVRYPEMIKDLWKYEGVRGIYKGNFVAQIKNTQMVPQMLLYELLNEASWNPLQNNSLFLIDRSFLSGVAAKTLASCMIYYPVDVVRTNIRDKREKKVTILQVVREIKARRGGYLNFYRGVGIYWLSSVPTFGLITYGMNKLEKHFKD